MINSDVEVLKPVEQWGINPGWEGLIAKDYVPPSFIAGVEADVGDRADWVRLLFNFPRQENF